MCDVYGRVCFGQENIYRLDKLFKEGRNRIQDENRTGRPPMASTPEMVDSTNALILDDRKVIIEDISEQLRIPVGTAYKTEHDDLIFSKFCCCWALQAQCQTSNCSKKSGNHQ